MEAVDRVVGTRAGRHGLVAEAGGPRLSVEAVADTILRVRFRQSRLRRPRRSWAPVDPAGAGGPGAVEVVLDDAAGPGADALVRTPSLDARLAGDGCLTISRRDGAALVDDARASWSTTGPLTRWTHAMPRGRRFFGLGERTGPLDARGRRHAFWTTDAWERLDEATEALSVAIPWLLALDPDGSAFGVLLDTTFRSVIDLTDTTGETVTLEADSDALDWYLVDGPGPGDVLHRLAELVGRPALPPRWALGYHQARWGYATADTVRDVAAALRGHAIPADTIHLDIDHMDRCRDFSWNRAAFPDPSGLVGDLADAGLRTTVVVDAGVPRDPDDPVHAAGRRIDAFVRVSRDRDAEEVTGYVWPGVCVWPDHARPDVRGWWGTLYRRYLDAGIVGFLHDMNEPAMHDRPMDAPGSTKIEPPPTAAFGHGRDAATHAEVRNVYGRLMNRAARQGMLITRPDRRPMLLTRSGCAGLQREAIVWTGDNRSTWEQLATSLPQILGLGLSGVAIAGADIGGFLGDCTPELLVRWMQLGSLYPFARSNSARDTAPQEPWAFGEPTTARCRSAIELRYRLLPYLYTVVHGAALTGHPVLRPVWFGQPEDAVALGVEDEALLGPDLLVAPVLLPGVVRRSAWLPPGRWTDLRTGATHDGEQRVELDASLDDDVPLLVRRGSIIPMAPPMRWSDERPLDPLLLHVFADAMGAATGSLYEDDGVSLAYTRGDWCETRFVASAAPDGTTTVSGTRAGAHVPPARSVEVVVHAADGGPARRAFVPDADEWSVAVAGVPRRGTMRS